MHKWWRLIEKRKLGLSGWNGSVGAQKQGQFPAPGPSRLYLEIKIDDYCKNSITHLGHSENVLILPLFGTTSNPPSLCCLEKPSKTPIWCPYFPTYNPQLILHCQVNKGPLLFGTQCLASAPDAPPSPGILPHTHCSLQGRALLCVPGFVRTNPAAWCPVCMPPPSHCLTKLLSTFHVESNSSVGKHPRQPWWYPWVVPLQPFGSTIHTASAHTVWSMCHVFHQTQWEPGLRFNSSRV